jgi:tetratricopeptide (TPR) repeat protein
MNLRLASAPFALAAMFALAAPLSAQAPAASEVEAIFYKAFYLEKGQRDFAGAMTLYEQFLSKAPEHKLAGEAARQQFALLDRTGKTKERDDFRAKYGKLLGAAAEAPARPAAAEGRGEGRPEGRGEGRGEGRPDGQRPQRGGDMAARMAELEKQLAAARESGDEEAVKRLEQQLERMKQAGERGPRGEGGQPGQGRRGGGIFGLLGGDKKFADMSTEEIQQVKDGLGQASTMIERMRDGGMTEQADKLEAGIDSLKKALDANKLDDAQKALEALRASMPRRGGRGGGGGGV